MPPVTEAVPPFTPGCRPGTACTDWIRTLCGELPRLADAS